MISGDLMPSGCFVAMQQKILFCNTIHKAMFLQTEPKVNFEQSGNILAFQYFVWKHLYCSGSKLIFSNIGLDRMVQNTCGSL